MKIHYAVEAIADLKRLREFIAIKNPVAATEAAQSIIKGISQLQLNPLLGKALPTAPDPESIRDLIINNYTVRYLLVPQNIYVLRVWHHREDKPASY